MGVPLYYKIYNDLLRKISSEEYFPGSVLPTDSEFEKIYGVSRAPVRQALEKLKNEGLIDRRPGCRTRVKALKRSTPWLLKSGMQRHYQENWSDLTCHTCLIEMTRIPEPAREFFLDASGTLIPHLIRVRCLNGIPVVLMHNYLSPKLASIRFDGVGDFSSLKEYLFTQRGISVTMTEEKLRSAPIVGSDAQYLKVEDFSPQLVVQRYSYDQYRLPLVYDEHYVRSDIWQYEVTFEQ